MINSNYKKTRNELEENNIQKLFFGTKEQSAMKTHASKLIFFSVLFEGQLKKKTNNFRNAPLDFAQEKGNKK